MRIYEGEKKMSKRNVNSNGRGHMRGETRNCAIAENDEYNRRNIMLQQMHWKRLRILNYKNQYCKGSKEGQCGSSYYTEGSYL